MRFTGLRARISDLRVRQGLASAAVLAGAALAFGGAAVGVDQDLHGLRSGLRPVRASGRVALVEIDARTLAALNRWPLPRSVYGRAVDAANAAGAEQIAFDVDVSAPSFPREDVAFADALARSRAPVALPVFIQAAQQDGRGRVTDAPIEALRRSASLAEVNVSPDADGAVRRLPYAVAVEGATHPSLASLLAGASGTAGRTFLIDPAIDPATIPSFSLLDLLQGRLPPRALAGRRVLIGATAIEIGDRYGVSRHGVQPGVLVQALGAESLMRPSSRFSLGPWPALAAAAAVLLIAAGLSRRSRVLLCLLLAAGMLAAPLLLEALGAPTIDIAPALAAAGLAALMFWAADGLEDLRRARLTDGATGLPNRRALRELVARRRNRARTLVTVRLRDQGDLLPLLGEEGLTLVLATWAKRLQPLTGAQPHRVGDAALGWLAIDRGAEDEETVLRRAATLRDVLSAAVEANGRVFQPAGAFGVASALAGEEAAGLISNSLQAADRAAAGGAVLQRHDAGWSAASESRVDLVADFERACMNGDVWVAYQPKLDIASDRVCSAEALVRWRHPQRGPLSPDQFVPLLESSGLISSLTLHVFARVLQDMSDWSSRGLHPTVAVNVSASLPADEGFVAALTALITAYPQHAGRLGVEITESAALEEPERAAEALNRLTALGLSVSIDDYGTGQSTLSYLRVLPASEIKIDRTFISNLETSRSDQAMVRSTIDLAHQLGLSVVAEGVETQACLDLLRQLGCDTAQGWLVGRPVSAEEFAKPAGALAAAADPSGADRHPVAEAA